MKSLENVKVVTNYNEESLYWAIIGAAGSWAGSVFGAIALVVSIFAFWDPKRVKIAASISTGIMLSIICREID